MELSKVNTMKLNGVLWRECIRSWGPVFSTFYQRLTPVSITFRLASLCQGLLQMTEMLSLYNTNITITCTINTHPDNLLHLWDVVMLKKETMGREGGRVGGRKGGKEEREGDERTLEQNSEVQFQLFLSSLGPWAILFPYMNMSSIICKWRKHLQAFSKDKMKICGKCFVHYVSL